MIRAALLGFAAASCSPTPTGDASYMLTAAEAQQVECLSDEMRERVRVLMIEAIDDALKDQIMHLFETWMKDARDQPRRATIGARQAIRAYIGSREAAKVWSPPRCP